MFGSVSVLVFRSRGVAKPLVRSGDILVEFFRPLFSNGIPLHIQALPTDPRHSPRCMRTGLHSRRARATRFGERPGWLHE